MRKAALLFLLLPQVIWGEKLKVLLPVWCEGKATEVEVVAYPAGGQAAFDPLWAEKPLARAKGKPGETLTLELDAPLPVRLEARAEGHVSMGFFLYHPQQLPLPPAWLEEGKKRTVVLAEAAGDRVVLFSSLGAGPRAPATLDRWQKVVSSQALVRGKGEVVLPAEEELPTVLMDSQGRWAWARLTAKSSLPGFRCRPVLVRVRDLHGQVLPEVSVAVEEAPLGAGKRTAADGTCQLCMPADSRQRVVALKEEQGAWGLAKGGELNLTLRPLESVLLVSAAPYPVLLANPSWLPAALGGPRLLPGQGGPLPFLAPGGFLQLAAPGFVGTTLTVSGAGRSLGVRLVRAGRLAGSLEDRRGQPVPGAAVLVTEEPAEVFNGRRFRFPTPEQVAAVTDAKGSFLIPSVVPGQVRVRARAGEAWAPEEQVGLEPGGEVTLQLRLASGTSLAFSLQDPEGRPVAGAEVRVFRGEEEGGLLFRRFGEEEQPLTKVSSDAQGQVRLVGLPPGNLRLSVKAAGFVTLSQPVSLPPEGADLGSLVLEPGSELAGRVVDEKGEGVAGVVVAAGLTPDGLSGERVVTDAQGYFFLPEQPRHGALYLSVRGGSVRSTKATKVELPVSGPVELRVERGRTLRGRVVDEETGEGIAGASVRVRRTVTRTFGGFTVVTEEILAEGVVSGEDGSFQVEGVPVGQLRVEASAPGYAQGASTLEVEAETPLRTITLRLAPGLAISGRVLDSQGQPAVGVWVAASPAQDQAPTGFRLPRLQTVSTVTDGEGNFQLAGLSAGKYQVSATSPEGQEDRLLVEAGTADVELRLSSPGDLEIVVVDKKGAPVAGAKVGGSGPEGDLPARTTDGSGWVRFEKLRPGRYLLYVSAPGKANAREDVQVSGEAKTAKTITLAEGGVVEGLIRGLSAKELEQVRVRAGGSFTTPDASGRFRLEGVPLGSTEVEAWLFPGGKGREAMVEVSANAPAYVELDFSQGWTLSGSLRQGGRGLAGYVIAAISQGTGAFSDVTDESGRFRLTGLGTGSYRVVASDIGGQALATAQVEVSKDTELELVVPEGQLLGQVVDQVSGAPVAEAQVVLQLANDAAFRRAATTSQKGDFQFDKLPSGRFTLRAMAAGYSPKELSVEVGAAQLAPLRVALAKEQALELLVRGADGSVPDSVLILASAGGSRLAAWVNLDREGRGLVTSFPAGEHFCLVRGNGAALLTLRVPSQTTVQLQPTGKLRLYAGEKEVRLAVTLPSGPPLPFGQGEPDGLLPLPAKGQIWFELPAGEYQLVWQAEGQSHRKLVTVPPEGEEVVLLASGEP